jgi:hypothetical protein
LATLAGIAACGLLTAGSAHAQGDMMMPGITSDSPGAQVDSAFFDYPSQGIHFDALGNIIPYDTYTGPVFTHYPFVAPGALNIYTYTPYTGNPFAEGTLYGRIDKKTLQAPDALSRRMDMENEEENPDIDPAPINYPFAAPGSLHLYHYSDYNEDQLVTGDLDRDRMERERRREMRMQRMKKTDK